MSQLGPKGKGRRKEGWKQLNDALEDGESDGEVVEATKDDTDEEDPLGVCKSLVRVSLGIVVGRAGRVYLCFRGTVFDCKTCILRRGVHGGGGEGGASVACGG